MSVHAKEVECVLSFECAFGYVHFKNMYVSVHIIYNIIYML